MPGASYSGGVEVTGRVELDLGEQVGQESGQNACNLRRCHILIHVAAALRVQHADVLRSDRKTAPRVKDRATSDIGVAVPNLESFEIPECVQAELRMRMKSDVRRKIRCVTPIVR